MIGLLFVVSPISHLMYSTKLNKNVWSEWSSSSPQTDHVLFADYNTTGPGATSLTRPSFATALSDSDAASYTIGSVVGSDYLSWVDTSYLLSSSL